MSKTYGYSRVSTFEQETEKFQGEILRYSNNNDLGRVIFVEEKVSGTKDWTKREIGKLINETCEEGDTILVPELSRISRNIIQIYEIISTCMDKGITLHFLKQNLVIKKDNDITTKVMLSTFSLISEMERTFISERTKESLSYKKRMGVKLGRPRGVGKSRLDEYKDEIFSFINNGSTLVWISKHYNVTPTTLSNWLKKHRE